MTDAPGICQFYVHEPHTPPGRRPRLIECGKPATWCRYNPRDRVYHSFACDDHLDRIARDAAWYDEEVVPHGGPSEHGR